MDSNSLFASAAIRKHSLASSSSPRGTLLFPRLINVSADACPRTLSSMTLAVSRSEAAPDHCRACNLTVPRFAQASELSGSMSMALDHLWMASSRSSPAANASSNAFCKALFCTGSAWASPLAPIRVHATAADVHVAAYIQTSRRRHVGSDPSGPSLPPAQIFHLPRPDRRLASRRTFHLPPTACIVATAFANGEARFGDADDVRATPTCPSYIGS
mmetsp:Transcript_11304/g.69798  ORF Transcript_11304/g.69798 Transcript_11304/m.69798 type:complete len:216 (-) Transcript_11304:259-906(-)